MTDIKFIDPEIRDAVLALNRLGYKTVSSCAGHSESPEEEPVGDILFARRYPHRKLRELLKDFGLDVISVEDISNPWYPRPRTRVTFQPLGGVSIEAPTTEPKPKRLPGKQEATDYFLSQGMSRKEARTLARLTGYKEGDEVEYKE